jgi:tRNA pseudouridine38-40 synthase
MNAVLPRDIAVTSVAEAAPTFHPRFDAASRTYRYLIWNRPVRCPFCEGRAAHVKPPLDEGAMHTALQAIVGRHDFTSFVPNALAGSRERTVWSAECRRDGWTVAVEIEAQGFMRQMIRAIVGTLIDVGRGAIVAEDFAAILAARDRRRGGRTAPAHGLYLLDVRYEPAGDRGTPRLDPALQVQGWESSLDEEKR